MFLIVGRLTLVSPANLCANALAFFQEIELPKVHPLNIGRTLQAIQRESRSTVQKMFDGFRMLEECNLMFFSCCLKLDGLLERIEVIHCWWFAVIELGEGNHGFGFDSFDLVCRPLLRCLDLYGDPQKHPIIPPTLRAFSSPTTLRLTQDLASHHLGRPKRETGEAINLEAWSNVTSEHA